MKIKISQYLNFIQKSTFAIFHHNEKPINDFSHDLTLSKEYIYNNEPVRLEAIRISPTLSTKKSFWKKSLLVSPSIEINCIVSHKFYSETYNGCRSIPLDEFLKNIRQSWDYSNKINEIVTDLNQAKKEK